MGICEVEKSYLGGASFAIALTGSILAPSGNVNLILLLSAKTQKGINIPPEAL
jgi:hypothetical protein